MLEVNRPHLMRFSFAWIVDGQPGPETEIRVAFLADGLGTRLRFEQIGFSDNTSVDGHLQGWAECLDRLAGFDARSVEADG